jgi:hypothetical protein
MHLTKTNYGTKTKLIFSEIYWWNLLCVGNHWRFGMENQIFFPKSVLWLPAHVWITIRGWASTPPWKYFPRQSLYWQLYCSLPMDSPMIYCSSLTHRQHVSSPNSWNSKQQRGWNLLVKWEIWHWRCGTSILASSNVCCMWICRLSEQELLTRAETLKVKYGDGNDNPTSVNTLPFSI